MNRVTPVVATLLVLLTPSVGVAEGEAPTDGDSDKWIMDLPIEELMNLEITTSSRYEQKATAASAKVIVITAKMIRDRGYFDLLDLLRALPYFQVQSEFGHWTKGAILNLRGLRSGDSGNNKFLILMDGTKLSDDAGEGLFLGLNSIPLHAVKQVEVVYGPNSTLYGRDAYAGMINIITMDRDYAEARASGGTYGTRMFSGGFYKKLSDDVYGYANLASYGSDEQDPTEDSISYVRRHATTAHPYTERFFRGTNNLFANAGLGLYGLSLKYLFSDVAAAETYGGNPDLYVSEYSTRSYLQNEILQAEYSREFLPGLTASARYTYRRYELLPKTANLYVADVHRDPTDPLYAYAGRKYYTFRTTTHKAGVNVVYEITEDLKTVSGLDAQFIRGIPVQSSGKGGKPITTDEQREELERSFELWGLYTELTYQVIDSLSLVLGGRYEISSSYRNTLMPRGAAVARLGDHTIKAIVSRGYLAPSVTQVYFTSKTEFSFIKPNQDLEAEDNISFELDWVYAADDLSLTANAFYSRLENAIVESLPTGTNERITIGNDTYDVPVLQSQNVGSGYRFGAAAGGEWRVDPMLSLNANFSFLVGSDESQSGDTIEIRDNLVSSYVANIGAHLKYEIFSLYAHVQWASKRRIRSAHRDTNWAFLLDEEGFLNFPAVTTLNAHFRLNDVYKGLSFFARVRNVLGEEYYGQSITANWGSPHVLQDKRRVMVGLEYRL